MGSKKRKIDKNFFTDAVQHKNGEGEMVKSWRTAFKGFWKKRGVEEGNPYNGKISYARRDTSDT
jgi:hypothetical protein